MKKNYIIGILVLFVLILSITTFYFWTKYETISMCRYSENDIKNEFTKTEEVKNNQKEEIVEEEKVESEFKYNYSNTEFAEKEKLVLEIGKSETIKKYGYENYKKEFPLEAKRFLCKDIETYCKELNLSENEHIWFFSGTLNCGCKKDEKCICKGGVVEVSISDKDLKVLKIIHGK